MKKLLLLAITLCCLLIPVTSFAYNPLDNACQSGGKAQSSSACSVNGANDPIAGPHGALKKVSMIIATIAGVAAVIVLVVGGLELVTSGGDPQKAASARNTVIGAIIGLVIILAAESIIVFVVNKV